MVNKNKHNILFNNVNCKLMQKVYKFIQLNSLFNEQRKLLKNIFLRQWCLNLMQWYTHLG